MLRENLKAIPGMEVRAAVTVHPTRLLAEPPPELRRVWAKAFGQLLNFNCALILYPVIRSVLRRINDQNMSKDKSYSGSVSRFIPLHKNIAFHKLVGWTVTVCTIGHILAHSVNYYKAPDATSAIFPWTAWASGWLVTIALFIIVAGSRSAVKRSHYELFWNAPFSYSSFRTHYP